MAYRTQQTVRVVMTG